MLALCCENVGAENLTTVEKPRRCCQGISLVTICRYFLSEPPRTRTWNLEIKSGEAGPQHRLRLDLRGAGRCGIPGRQALTGAVASRRRTFIAAYGNPAGRVRGVFRRWQRPNG